MEGYSEIVYKDKKIIYVDLSIFSKDKAKALQLLKAVHEEWTKQPLASIIALVNISGARLDQELVAAFKKYSTLNAPHVKKIAMIGVKGFLKVAYNLIASNASAMSKAFETESEAKEWLAED